MRALDLPASTEGMLELVRHVLEFAEQTGLSAQQSYLLRLTAEEIVGNILEHGCVEDAGENITVILEDRTDRIRLVVIDSSAAFDPSELGPPPALERGQSGGVGLFLIRSLIGEIGYRRRAGRNETTVMFDRERPD